jgi:hypothetical protein
LTPIDTTLKLEAYFETTLALSEFSYLPQTEPRSEIVTMWLCPTPASNGSSDQTVFENDDKSISSKEDENNTSQQMTPGWLCPTVPSDDEVTMEGDDKGDEDNKYVADDSIDEDHHSLESIPDSPAHHLYGVPHSISNQDDGISPKNSSSTDDDSLFNKRKTGATTMSLGSWTAGSGMNINRTVSESSHFSANANSYLNPVLWENPSSILAPGMVTIDRMADNDNAAIITPQTSPGSQSSEEMTFHETTSTSIDEDDTFGHSSTNGKASTFWRVIQIVAVVGLFVQINPAVVDTARSMILEATSSSTNQAPQELVVEYAKAAAKSQLEKSAELKKQQPDANIPVVSGGLDELLNVIKEEDPEQPFLRERRAKASTQIPAREDSAGGLSEFLETLEEEEEDDNDREDLTRDEVLESSSEMIEEVQVESDVQEVPQVEEEEENTYQDEEEVVVTPPPEEEQPVITDDEVKRRAQEVLEEMELDEEVKIRARKVLESFYAVDQELSQRWKSPIAGGGNGAIEA